MKFLQYVLQIYKLQTMNLLNNLQQQYDQLWKYIIRPTRSTYPDKNLGPEVFELQGKKVKRQEFQLINPRGHVLFCSHFIPLEEERYPCVIYMHGNSSNRTQGMEYLGHLIRKNISLCTFDFSGCGNSQGEYISLGYYQQYDLNEVCEYIRHRSQVTSIAIWGRSMGAVTGLLYAKNSPYLSAVVFDSPFKSLKSLVQDMCKKNSKIPAIIISGALKIISKTIEQKARFDIYKINPLKNEVPFLNMPAFFIVGMQDDMIPPEHTLTLYEKYHGVIKKLQKVKGNHNDPRPEQCVNKVIKFLIKYLKTEKSQKQILTQKSPPKMISAKRQIDKQIDFFQQEIQIEDSSKQTQEIDFFAQDISTQITTSKQPQGFDELNFHQQQITTAKLPHNQTFSLTSMLSNVFSVVNITKSGIEQKRGVDGYQKAIERISRQVYIDETANYIRVKSRLEDYQYKVREEIKSCKNEWLLFQKEIIANLQTWGF